MTVQRGGGQVTGKSLKEHSWKNYNAIRQDRVENKALKLQGRIFNEKSDHRPKRVSMDVIDLASMFTAAD
jgi:hypothetical protein